MTDAPDPLGHIRVGDPDPTADNVDCCLAHGRGRGFCTRQPHSPRWQHIAGTEIDVLAVWTDTEAP